MNQRPIPSNSDPAWRFKRRSRRRARIALTISIATSAGLAAACGGSATVSPQTVRACLSSAGFRVTGGPVSTALRGNSGAIAELITPGTFIAFYPSHTAAAQAQPSVLQNVRRLHGSITRRHDVTILFVGSPLSARQRQKLLGCIP